MTISTLGTAGAWVALGIAASGWGLLFASAASDASTNRSRLPRSSSVIRGALWRGLVGVVAATLVASLVEGGSSLVRPALIVALAGGAVAGHYLGRSAWARVAQRMRIRPWLSVCIVLAIVVVLGGLAVLTGSGAHDAALESSVDAPLGRWYATLAPVTGMLGSALSPAPATLGLVALLAMVDAGLRLLNARPDVSRGAGTIALVAGLAVVLVATGLLAAAEVPAWPADAAGALLAVVSLAYAIDYWARPNATAKDAATAGFAAAASIVIVPWGAVLLVLVAVAVCVRIARRPPARKRPTFGSVFGKALGAPLLWAVVLAMLEGIRRLVA